MFTRSNFELKVGIFIFIGIVILSVIIFSVGNFYTLKRGYTMDILFSFANGVSVGAPVRYAGVEVGEVQDIEVYFDEKENRPMVRMLVWISQNTWVNEDAKATINTLGLLGEKYLEIMPGTKERRLLQKGDTLRGHDPISTEELTRETRKTLAKIDSMVESINDVMEDIKQGKGTLGRLMTDDKLYNDIDEMILDIKKNPWKLLHKPREKRKK